MSSTRRWLSQPVFIVLAVFTWSTQTAQAAVDPPPPPAIPAWRDFELSPYALPSSDIPIAAAPPDTALITDFVGRAQSLPLSCESRSAADWAAYFGVSLNELEFFQALPVSSDPDKGFVGDVRGTWGQLPPNAYGVHAGPVARLLAEYGLPANFQIQTPWSTVQAEVAAGRPVIVWVSGHVWAGTGQLYTAPDGHRTVVAPFEHTVIVIGYDANSVTVEDEGRDYTRPLDVFLRSWAALRNMAITATPA